MQNLQAFRQTSATGVPSSACRRMKAIYASENFDFFMEFSFSHHRDHNGKIPSLNGPIWPEQVSERSASLVG